MKRLLFATAAAGLVLTALGATPRVANAQAPPKVIDGRVADWTGTSSLLGGRSELSRGEFIYQDHVYDDYGGLTFDAGAPQRQAVEPTAGGYRYPTDEARYANNVADLFQLRIAATGDRVAVLAWLNALRAPDTTIVSVGFDVDGVTPALARQFPHNAGLTAPGVDIVVSAWGTGGDVVDLRTGNVTPLASVAANIDDNAIEFSVPRAALPGAKWTLWAATGLWDAASGGFMEVPSGDPTPTAPGHGGNGSTGRAFNIAFRDRETGPYMESKQADAIRNGDIGAFSATVEVAALSRGESGAPASLRRGEFQDVIVDEHRTIGPGEGQDFDTGVAGRQGGVGPLQESVSFQYYGRFQPYGLYVPKDFDGKTPSPSAIVFHGSGGTYASYNRQPGFLSDMGERPGLPGLVMITPLARGESFCVDYGEESVLDALDDLAQRVPLDRDRQYDTGYSMGGYCAFRFAVRYPDRFAALVSWAGFTGEYLGTYDATAPLDYNTLTGDPGRINQDVFQPYIGAPVLGTDGSSNPIEYTALNGDPVRVLENLRHIPVLQLGGTNDEVVPISGQLAAWKRLGDLGYRRSFDLYPGYEHFSFALVDDWKAPRDFLGNRSRITAPRDIDFSTSPAWNDPTVADGLRLPTPSAWWVKGLKVRSHSDDVTQPARIKAVSLAIVEPSVTPTLTAGAGPTPTPHVSSGAEWALGAPDAIANRLEVTLTNAAEATVDVGWAGLEPSTMQIRLTSDGAAVLHLVRGASVLGDVVARGVGSVETRGVPSASRGNATLPATGRNEQFGVAGVAMAMAMGIRWTRHRRLAQ